MVFSLLYFCIRDGEIKITGSTFTDNGAFTLLAADFSNCKVEITNNEIESLFWNDIVIFQGFFFPIESPSSFLLARNHIVASAENAAAIAFIQDAAWYPEPIAPSYVTITKNDIQTTGDGIVLQDSDYWNLGVATLHAVISKNNIFLNNASWGAIQLIGGQGTRITNNRIYGKGWTGSRPKHAIFPWKRGSRSSTGWESFGGNAFGPGNCRASRKP